MPLRLHSFVLDKIGPSHGIQILFWILASDQVNYIRFLFLLCLLINYNTIWDFIWTFSGSRFLFHLIYQIFYVRSLVDQCYSKPNQRVSAGSGPTIDQVKSHLQVGFEFFYLRQEINVIVILCKPDEICMVAGYIIYSTPSVLQRKRGNPRLPKFLDALGCNLSIIFQSIYSTHIYSITIVLLKSFLQSISSF